MTVNGGQSWFIMDGYGQSMMVIMIAHGFLIVPHANTLFMVNDSYLAGITSC